MVPLLNPKSVFFIANQDVTIWSCQDGVLGHVSGPSGHQWSLGIRNVKSSLDRLKDREMTDFLNMLFVDIRLNMESIKFMTILIDVRNSFKVITKIGHVFSLKETHVTFIYKRKAMNWQASL